jgi:hypothetical protein
MASRYSSRIRDLPAVRARWRAEVEHLGELLGDRARPLDRLASHRVGPGRGDQAGGVDRPLVPEVAVLDGDGRLTQHRGDLGERDGVAALPVGVQVGEERAVAVEDDGVRGEPPGVGDGAEAVVEQRQHGPATPEAEHRRGPQHGGEEGRPGEAPPPAAPRRDAAAEHGGMDAGADAAARRQGAGGGAGAREAGHGVWRT